MKILHWICWNKYVRSSVLRLNNWQCRNKLIQISVACQAPLTVILQTKNVQSVMLHISFGLHQSAVSSLAVTAVGSSQSSSQSALTSLAGRWPWPLPAWATRHFINISEENVWWTATRGVWAGERRAVERRDTEETAEDSRSPLVHSLTEEESTPYPHTSDTHAHLTLSQSHTCAPTTHSVTFSSIKTFRRHQTRAHSATLSTTQISRHSPEHVCKTIITLRHKHSQSNKTCAHITTQTLTHRRKKHARTSTHPNIHRRERHMRTHTTITHTRKGIDTLRTQPHSHPTYLILLSWHIHIHIHI